MGIATEMSFLTKSPHPNLTFPAKREMPADWFSGSCYQNPKQETVAGPRHALTERGGGAGRWAGPKRGVGEGWQETTRKAPSRGPQPPQPARALPSRILLPCL